MECGRTRVVLGIADGGIPVWSVLPGVPLMANALTTRRFPPREAGELWVDSGGYQALRRGARLSVDWVAERYSEIDADLYIMLDEPPGEGVGGWDDARTNVGLYEELYSRLEDKTIVPVVHHYDPEALAWAIERIESYQPPVLAVGGSVPGLLNRGKKRAATIVYLALVRKLWRRRLHVLGAGSPVMRCILSVIGADTADTATWRAKAAYGKVIIPGAGERYVGERRIRYGPLHASPEDIENLRRFLERTGFPLPPGGDGLRSILQSFRGRALVNAWVLALAEPAPGRGYRWILSLARHASGLSVEELVELHERALSTQRVRDLVPERGVATA